MSESEARLASDCSGRDELRPPRLIDSIEQRVLIDVHQLLQQLVTEGAAHDGGTARPIAPKDAENLRYLRARVGEGNAVLRDPLRIDPTSIRYFKVYDQYRKAVEASLLLVALTRSQEELRERAAEYGTWFPDVPFVMQNLEEKLRKAPEVTRPRS